MVYDTASRTMRKPLAPPKNTPVDDIEVRYRHQAMHLLCIAGLGGRGRVLFVSNLIYSRFSEIAKSSPELLA